MVRNLDKSEGEGFFAPIEGEAPLNTTRQDVPLMALQYLRERLMIMTANSKEVLHGTRLNAPMGPVVSGIMKLTNLVHRQVLSDEQHVANLKCLKDEFGISMTAAMTSGLLKAFMNVTSMYPMSDKWLCSLSNSAGVVLLKEFGKNCRK